MPTRKKAESQRAAEGKNTAAQGPPPQKQSQLLRELLVTKVGLFGSPEKKLRSDIAKKLNIPKKDSFSENSLIAYSQLKGVKEKLEKVRAEVAKRGARGAGIIIKGSKEKDALIAKRPRKKLTLRKMLLRERLTLRKMLLRELPGRIGKRQKRGL